jgi:hypothetical protein
VRLSVSLTFVTAGRGLAASDSGTSFGSVLRRRSKKLFRRTIGCGHAQSSGPLCNSQLRITDCTFPSPGADSASI